MRITKHRGKREDNGEWVYGAFYPIKDEYVFFIINNCKSIDFDDDDTTFNGHKVHKKSVGEFTGLHDKNGKEVFEGDMCGLNLKIHKKVTLEIGDTLEFFTREIVERHLK